MTVYGKAMTVAFAISATTHLGGLGVWCAIESGWLPRLELLSRKGINPEKMVQLPQRELQKQPPESISRLVFVETDALDKELEPLKKTEYYSKRSTRAANPKPDTAKLGDLPKLEGKEKHIMSTADAALPRPPSTAGETNTELKALSTPPKSPIQNPATTSYSESEKTVFLSPPKTTVEQSDFALLPKENSSLQPAIVDPPTIERRQETNAHPVKTSGSTLARVSPRKIPTRLSEQKETSVARKGKVTLDVKGSLFGAYDEQLQAEVARRWYAIVEKYEYGERTGIVEIYFKLHSDGRIEDLAIKQNTAGEVLAQYCKKAIDDSTPFEPFPEELKALLAREYREINFIFYY